MLSIIRIIATAVIIIESALIVQIIARPTVVHEPLPEIAAAHQVQRTFVQHCNKSAPADFDALVIASAQEFEIDPRMLAATVYRESECDALALGSSGEIGLAQVHPKYWRHTLVDAGIIQTTQDLWSPETNLRASAYILARLSKSAKGDVTDTFRRYNGSGAAAHAYAQAQTRVFHAL